MAKLDCSCARPLNRRQVLALLASFGVTREALAQDATTADPRSYRVVTRERPRARDRVQEPAGPRRMRTRHALPP